MHILYNLHLSYKNISSYRVIPECIIFRAWVKTKFVYLFIQFEQ